MINGPAYRQWIEATGHLSENVTTAAWFDPAEQYTSHDLFGSTANFAALFSAKYGALPDFTQASGAAVGVVLQMAIGRAASLDPDPVRAQLVKGGFDTFFGPISFNSNGMADSYTPPILQIQNGKVRVIAPEAIKDADFKLGAE
jgi:branched-chain amino acid transport system substrate-binding protein